MIRFNKIKKANNKEHKLYFDFTKKEITPSVQPVLLPISSKENTRRQSSIISADDISENSDGIHENGWKQHLQSQKIPISKTNSNKQSQIEATRTSVKDSSDKNPDYRSSPTYEEYLRSKSSTIGTKKIEVRPEDITKIHYLG